MKVQFLLPLTIVVSVALVGLMKIRQKEQDREGRRGKFQDIKLRVTYDVLGEYQNEMLEADNHLDKAQSLLKALGEEVNMLQVKADKAEADAEICKGGQKTINDEVALQETTLDNLKSELKKEKMSWIKEFETLKQQLASRSAVCGFLKAGSDVASKLCNNDVEAPKEGEAKAEAPKQEEPKAEAPKQEGEAKAEAPKQEEPEAEAPKQEGEAKAEAPKQEEPEAEAPKQEEPKAEAPKQEGEAKAEAPKKKDTKDAPKKRRG